MRYLLVIFFSLFISLNIADNLYLKEKEEDRIKIEEINKLFNDSYVTTEKQAVDFLKNIYRKVLDKKENYEDYNIIKKENFILIENKTLKPSQEFSSTNFSLRTDENCPTCIGIIFYGNENSVFRYIPYTFNPYIHFLISKPTPYNCHDYHISEYAWKDNGWEINEFPLVDYPHYENKMGLYTISYFGKKSKAIVIAISHARWLVDYLVIDTVSGKYDIIQSIKCGEFPLSIIKAASVNKVYEPFIGKTSGILKGNIKNSKPEGEWIEYYDNNKLMKRGEYFNGKEEGEWLEYWDNGQLKSKVNYKDGKEEGEELLYYKNGQLGIKRNYKNGIEEGEWIYYKENGQLIRKGNNKDGKGEGEWIEYWENGQLKSRTNYKNDRVEVTWLEYYENSQLKTKMNLKDGKAEGKYLSYYENGQLRWIGNYKNGKEEGEWFWYGLEGDLRSVEVWKEGKLIENY